MPPIYCDGFIHTGIHDFKTNISKYIRILNKGEQCQIIVTSRGKEIGGFFTFEGHKKYTKREQMKEKLSGLLSGSGGDGTALLKELEEILNNA